MTHHPLAEIYQHRAQFYAALRSRRFKQAQGYLTVDPGLPTESHCCLGVGSVVAEENGLPLEYVDDSHRNYLDEEGHTCDGSEEFCTCYTNDTQLPQAVVDWYGFDDDDPDLDVTVSDGAGWSYETTLTAATLNDDKMFTFEQIADAFEAKYPAGPADPEGALEP